MRKLLTAINCEDPEYVPAWFIADIVSEHGFDRTYA